MSESPSGGVTSRLARLNPFSKSDDDDEEFGEEIDFTSVAGGGHSARPTEITRHQLRVSRALRQFLVEQGILAEEDAGLNYSDEPTAALHALLNKPHIEVPAWVTDRSRPLPEYFISSSHNTYLMAHQLYGTSSATAYETALNAGSRCVEIDAWDNADDKDEPKVTHGYTLVSHIPFRKVCETIRDVVDREAAAAAGATEPSGDGYGPAPILLSLENHCGPYGQKRLVQIMEEVWGDRLLSKDVREKGHDEQEGASDRHVRLSDLGSKIVVIVEYHIPNESSDTDDSSSDSSVDDETDDRENAEEKQARHAYKDQKSKAAEAGGAAVIVPELAELGVYAQSVKPSDNSWFDPGRLRNGPHHHLINVSEVGLAAQMPANAAPIAHHNARHLMRVFPKGTRISSKNLRPVSFWAVGAQICALNWQTFNASMQLNEALFSGTSGYVLKPARLRLAPGAEGSDPASDGTLGTILDAAVNNSNAMTRRRRKLVLRAAGATDVPLPADRKADDVKTYLTCTLVHPDTAMKKDSKRKTAAYRPHKLAFLHRGGENPPATDPVWDETLEWEYDDDDMTFLRLLLKSDDSFASNPIFAVAAVRLLYVAPGWSFIRMLDLKGRETKCSLLVKFEIEDA
jgi:phosphatidylinositol phospholipase C delta